MYLVNLTRPSLGLAEFIGNYYKDNSTNKKYKLTGASIADAGNDCGVVILLCSNKQTVYKCGSILDVLVPITKEEYEG